MKIKSTVVCVHCVTACGEVE